VLANRASVYVKFNTADERCVWNFKIEWSDPGYQDQVYLGAPRTFELSASAKW